MKQLFFFAGLLILSSSLYAQKTEVGISYGTSSIYGMTEEIMGSLISGLASSEYENSSRGVLNVAVTRYDQKMKWRYGGEFSTEFFSTDGNLTSLSYYSIGPKADYFWSPSEHKLRFYSGISAGVVFRVPKYYTSDQADEKSDTSAALGLNLALIGVRYGEDLAVYIDINGGNKGIFQLGLNYIF